MTKIILSFIGGFIIGFVIIFAWNTYTDSRALHPEGESTTPESMVSDTSIQSCTEDLLEETITNDSQSEYIHVENQSSGSAVSVTFATLAVDGWIVVHEERDGFIANALGAKRQDAGTHQNIIIPLLRDTKENTRYWVVLYSDNGDRQFSLTTDFPLRDETNKPITSYFEAY